MPRVAFDLRLLESFLALAEELHFGRAAEQLNVAQPGLSRQIRRLELQVGTTLFSRNAHGVELTAAGDAFRTSAVASLTAAHAGVDAARLAGRGASGRLRLVVSPGVLAFVRPLLNAFAAAFDQVDLETVSMTDAAAAAAVRDGAVDGAVVWSDEQPPSGFAMTSIPLTSVPVGVRLRSDHPLAALPQVPIDQLNELRLIIFPRDAGPEQHDRIVTAFGGPHRPGGVQHAPRVGAARREMMQALDHNSFTVGPLALEQEDGADGVTALALDPPDDPALLWLIWRHAPTGPIAAFLEVAHNASWQS